MSEIKGKHVVEEIDGVRCSVVESNIDDSRCSFLKDILENNKYLVKTEKVSKEGEPVTYKIGVTDVTFHAVIDVYKRRLISKTGHKVTPSYWMQKSTAETEAETNYYTFR